METNGKISFMPCSKNSPVVKKDIISKIDEESLVANVIIENQNSQQSKTQLLKEYQKLLKNEIITPEEFKKLKNELIFSNK